MIRVAINGYGNLGRGAELALAAAEDMECVVVFTRRDPESVKTLGAPVAHIDQMADWVDRVDVCLNCGGSATDLGTQVPQTLQYFNSVDSFDTHAKIPEYFAQVDAAGRAAGKLGIISSGWDPGIFSMIRALGQAVLPSGMTTTFWGPGVSQGHSDAVRRITGVVAAKQYTVPIAETVSAVKAGREVELTARTMHERKVFVVAADGADREAIEKEIVEMPNYFADYNTTVTFVDADTFQREHAGMPHGGQVIRRGETDAGVAHTINFGLELDANPEFTGAMVVATGRACYRMASRGRTGAATVFDIAIGDLCAESGAELRQHLL
ncbi:MAG: diaminopimelate dehydrogenase [Trueperella sp.]|nr:diaminopimelate dehydrogenase [Trueperella sp.]